MIGRIITGDFSENTITLEMETEYRIRAGKCSVMFLDELEKKLDKALKSETKESLIEWLEEVRSQNR